MSDEDPFRYCVHCGTDCYVDEPEHTNECPSVTNVWPVREKDLHRCENCGHPAHQMLCMDCGAALDVGDHYVHRLRDAGDPLLPGVAGAAVYEVICIGCAANEALT